MGGASLGARHILCQTKTNTFPTNTLALYPQYSVQGGVKHAKAVAIRKQEATRNKCIASSNKCLTSSNKKLVENKKLQMT